MEFLFEVGVIVAGLVLILGVIGFAVANSRGNKRRQRARERNTTFNPMDFIDSLEPEAGDAAARRRRTGNNANADAGAGALFGEDAPQPGAGHQQEQPRGEPPPTGTVGQIIVFYVMARGSGEFRVSGVNRVLTRAECVLDERGVFSLKDDEQRVVFSVVNALEPATFDATSMDVSTTRGVAFFFEAKGRGDKRRFDAMLSLARKLALEIEGELLDEKREPLSSVREASLRSDLSD